MNKYIVSAGVELEGGWRTQPPGMQHLHGDGSVRVSAPIVGEIASPPFRTWGGLINFIDDNYPHVVNNTCGLHTHWAIHPHHYPRLMELEFIRFFMAYIGRWAKSRLAKGSDDELKFWARCRGENQYCLPNHADDAMKQVLAPNRVNERYRAWNFSYRIHGTAECRLLPAFATTETAVDAIKAVGMGVVLYLRRKDFVPLIEENETEPGENPLLESAFDHETLNNLTELPATQESIF